MLCHMGKDARELYKILSWKEEGDEKKFGSFALHRKICYTNDMDSGS